MESINQNINALHASFCTARDIELELNQCHERFWHEALKAGITCESLTAAIKAREKRILAGVRHPECLKIKNLVGDSDKIAELLEEIAVINARKRIRLVDPARASILRATGRSDQVPEVPPQASREVIAKLAEELKRVAL